MAKKTFSELFSLKEAKWSGLTLPMFLVLLGIVAFIVYTPFNGVVGGFVRPNFLTIFTILAVFGILFGEIGDRIPVWNDYIGGGTVLVFFISAVMGTYNLVPQKMLDSIEIFYGKQPVNFLEIFIPALIVGSVLTVNRKTLVQAISGYIPLILVGVVGATIGGVITGLCFGKAPLDIVMNYVLPIMGGGTGAGAKNMQTFFSKYTIWILMGAVGFGTDVQEIINSLTPANLVIAIGIVLGAVIFIMLLSKTMKFYPIEAAITAGLCMANRGGSGDVAVLGAADRMELMSFAQISSRVGGAMMLIIGSIVFGIFG